MIRAERTSPTFPATSNPSSLFASSIETHAEFSTTPFAEAVASRVTVASCPSLVWLLVAETVAEDGKVTLTVWQASPVSVSS